MKLKVTEKLNKWKTLHCYCFSISDKAKIKLLQKRSNKKDDEFGNRARHV